MGMGTEDEDTSPGGSCACAACVQREEYFQAATRAAYRVTSIRTPGRHIDPWTVMLIDERDIIVVSTAGPTQEETLYRALRKMGVVA